MKFYFLFFISLCLFSCNNTKIDVVRDTNPVSQNTYRNALVKSLRNASLEERDSIMHSNAQFLTTQLASFLRKSNYTCVIDSISYHYGSGEAKDTASGDGNVYDGIFKDEPYALVHGGECFNSGLYVFIKCFNGTFSLKSRNSQKMTTVGTVFVIEKGKGINSYVDYQTSIWLAENFNLPLYKGKKWQEKNRISTDIALGLENSLDSVQVTVAVHPGYTFNLGNMTLTKK